VRFGAPFAAANCISSRRRRRFVGGVRRRPESAARMTALAKLEASLAPALFLSVLFRSVDNALAALVGLLVVEVMRAM
jgi:hypothetical protein